MRNHVLILHVVLGAMLFPLSVSGQVGDCPRSMGEAYLDAGNVRARILNNGGLFWRGSPHVYQVPKNSDANAIFAAGIWVSGYIDGQLRGAATRYGEWEFWSGPLDEAGNPPADCSMYDRVWEIKLEDIEAYKMYGAVSDNLHEWPWQLGAPVLDGDGISDNYNLAGGDLPELLGDQRLWWIMNDRGNVHVSSDADPVGLEVHASAHAFDHPGYISNVTFYKYRLINKNAQPFTDAYFSLFTDIDLGDFSDDYQGSDSLLHLGYAYNADNEDTGSQGYGIGPPAIGFTFLESAIADNDGRDNDRDGEADESGEMIGTTSVLQYFGGGGITEDPQDIDDYYNYSKGLWKDGKRILMGSMGSDHYEWPGHLPKTPTNFFYPGDPVTGGFWTERNVDNLGTPASPADRRFVTSSGPFSINPFDTLNISLAIVWSRGSDHLDSVTQLKQDVASVREAADVFLNLANIRRQPVPAPDQPVYALRFEQNYPNPFSDATTLTYSLPKPMHIRLAVYDVLGREVERLVDAGQSEGTYTVDFDGSWLPAGIYYARIEMDYLRFTKRIVKL